MIRYGFTPTIILKSNFNMSKQRQNQPIIIITDEKPTIHDTKTKVSMSFMPTDVLEFTWIRSTNESIVMNAEF